jgi:Uma2 family endonuclease
MSDPLREANYGVTIEAFRAFVDTRPDHEKWELIDGEVILNPAPTNRHQIIVGNLIYELQLLRRAVSASWLVYPGIGVTNPSDDYNQPEPDVMITPPIDDVSSWTSKVLVTFEVLSPFTMRRDLVRKRRFYIGLPGLSHYVILAQDRREATLFARSRGFSPLMFNDPDDRVEIDALGISLRLGELYRDVPID